MQTPTTGSPDLNGPRHPFSVDGSILRFPKRQVRDHVARQTRICFPLHAQYYCMRAEKKNTEVSSWMPQSRPRSSLITLMNDCYL